MSGRIVRWSTRGLLFCVFVALCGLGYLGVSYPAAVRDLSYDLRQSSLADTLNKIEFISEFAGHLSKLRPNAEGYYTLESYLEDSAANMSPTEQAKVAFYTGDTNQALHILSESDRSSDDVLLLEATIKLKEAIRILQRKNQYLPKARLGDISQTLKIDSIQSPSSSATELLKAAKRSSQQLIERGEESRKSLYRWLHILTDALLEGSYTDSYQLGEKFLTLFGRTKTNESLPTHFVDETEKRGLLQDDTAKGVAVEDFDRDGYLDIITASSFGPVRYYKNILGNHFEEETAERGLDGIIQGYTLSVADFNNDGWMDLFVTRPFHHYQLFENRGGIFRDITEQVGLKTTKTSKLFNCTWHSTWSDIDNDGDLDLFLSQWGQRAPLQEGLYTKPTASSVLYVNADGIFVDETERFGLADFVKGENYVSAAFGDYNGDGFQDLYLSSFSRAQSILLQNKEGRTFVKSSSFKRDTPGFTTGFIDINHDGKLDLFQAGNTQAFTAFKHLMSKREESNYANAIYGQKKDTSNTFEKTLAYFEGQFPLTTLGATYGDIDNDGCRDFYFGTGNPELWYLAPNFLYRSERREGRCESPLRAEPLADDTTVIEKGQGAVFFDQDNDGDLDAYLALGGLWQGDSSLNRFYTNELPTKNSWAKIRLQGDKTNRSGIGTTIKIIAESPRHALTTTYHQMDNATGFGSAPYIKHVGLYNANKATAEITWPVSKERRRYALRIGETNILDERGGILLSKPYKEAS